jgi:hypothetical protein
MSIAGVVTYKINQDGSLDGRWTHPDLMGKTGTEKASAGKLPGVRAVHIYGPDGTEISSGSLTIAALGDVYSLTWSVSQRGKQSVFTGIGLVNDNGSLAASFQEQEPSESTRP